MLKKQFYNVYLEKNVKIISDTIFLVEMRLLVISQAETKCILNRKKKLHFT